MAAPGWYRDPGSDRLARWFDGQEWTHHTVVMDDWRGKGSPPPPEDRTIVQGADAYPMPGDGGWAAPTGYEDFSGYDTFGSYEDEGDPREDYVGGGSHYRQPTLADRYREGPAWFRFGAPALLVLIVAVAVAAIAGGGSDGGGGGDVDLGDEDEVTLDEAIDVAYEAGFPAEVSEARLGSLLKLACEQVGETDGPEVVAQQIQRFGFDGSDQSAATDGLEAGGKALCGDEVRAEDPDFFRDVALLVGGSVPSSTTSTTVSSSSTTADDGVTSTTKAPTSTTKKPTTSTTKAPTSSTTTSTSSTTTTTPPSSTTSTTTEDSVPDEP